MKQLALLCVLSAGVAYAEPHAARDRDLHLDPDEGWGVPALEDMNSGGTCDCDSPQKPPSIPRAKAALFTLDVTGGLDEKSVRRDLSGLEAKLARCYELGDTRHGRNILRADLSIGPDGVVSDGYLRGVRDVIADCAYDELASVKFPKSAGDATISATFKMEPDYATPMEKAAPAKPAATVKITSVTVSGGLDQRISSQFMHRRAYSVADCYSTAREIRPHLSGTLNGVLTFNTEGHVTKAEISGVGGRLLHSCAQEALARTQIPKVASGGEVTVKMNLGG